jgi:hypothetical protein
MSASSSYRFRAERGFTLMEVLQGAGTTRDCEIPAGPPAAGCQGGSW